MGIIEDITDTVKGWIYDITNPIWTYAYNLYNDGWNYASQISKDLWKETDLLWDKLGVIPVLTYDVIKGWVDPLLEDLKAYGELLVTDAIDILSDCIHSAEVTLDTVNDYLDGVKPKIVSFSIWFTTRDVWFENKIVGYKEVVLEWVVDRFEWILDKVFTAEVE